MVTVTMNQIIAFRNNGNFFSEVNIPLKGAYKLNKIRQAVEKEQDFYTEKFREIINEYGKKDENGDVVLSEDEQRILIQDDKVEECEKALEELQSLEVEIENYDLTIDDLGDIKCKPDELEALMPFIA